MDDAPTATVAPETDATLSSPTRALRWFWLSALSVALLDQGTKAWVRANVPVGASVDLLPGWVHLAHVHNFGAAWGVLSGRRWLLVVVAVGVIAFVTSVARDVATRGKLASCALGLILGGALGNVYDRIAQGYVTDFVDLDTPFAWLRTFPVWNVADAALTVGAVLMLLSFLNRKDAKAPRKENAG